jgi:predicted ABC-type ATPase
MDPTPTPEGRDTPPQFILIAGANGSGKSTSATKLLPVSLPYLNADEIAKELNVSGGGKR